MLLHHVLTFREGSLPAGHQCMGRVEVIIVVTRVQVIMDGCPIEYLRFLLRLKAGALSQSLCLVLLLAFLLDYG